MAAEPSRQLILHPNQRQQSGASWCPTFTGQVSAGPSKKPNVHTHPDVVLYFNRTACQKMMIK